MAMSQTQDFFTLMGGRVRISRGRYNPTCDAVWLAAWAAPRCGAHVLDVGIGTGGVALCIAANCPNVHITGIDTSDEMITECAQNAKLNNTDIELIHADITTWRPDQTYDTVVTNPPYFHGTPAAHNAHHNADLTAWTRRCIARTRPRGTFATIVDAAACAQIIAAMADHCGDIEILPLVGARRVAERVLIRARAGTHGGTIIYPAQPMQCDAVLRDGLTVDAALSKLKQI